MVSLAKESEPRRGAPAYSGGRLPYLCDRSIQVDEFGKLFETIGYDLSASKIEHFRRHEDPTGEVAADEFAAAKRLHVTNDPAELARADVLVVAVPTPVDVGHKPDFSPLVSASRTCGRPPGCPWSGSRPRSSTRSARW